MKGLCHFLQRITGSQKHATNKDAFKTRGLGIHSPGYGLQKIQSTECHSSALKIFPVVQVFPVVQKVFPIVHKVFPVVQTVFPVVHKLFPIVHKVCPIVIYTNILREFV